MPNTGRRLPTSGGSWPHSTPRRQDHPVRPLPERGSVVRRDAGRGLRREGPRVGGAACRAHGDGRQARCPGCLDRPGAAVLRGCCAVGRSAPGRIRTADASLRTAALYPLSYGGLFHRTARAAGLRCRELPTRRRPGSRHASRRHRDATFGAEPARIGRRQGLRPSPLPAVTCFGAGRRPRQRPAGSKRLRTRMADRWTSSTSTPARAVTCARRRAPPCPAAGRTQAAGLPSPTLVERDIDTNEDWQRAFMTTIPVVELADRRLELATSPARIRRLLADVLDVPAAARG